MIKERFLAKKQNNTNQGIIKRSLKVPIIPEKSSSSLRDSYVDLQNKNQML